MKKNEEKNNPLYRATHHAYKRAKERLRWKKDTLDRMMEKAFTEGIKHSDTKGRLNKFISKLYLQYKTANNTRIYGQNIYFFKDNVLITLYRVPTNMIKYLKVVEIA